MRKHLTLAAAAAMLMSVPFAAQAFPVATSPVPGTEAPVTLVAGGCGIGFHRGPWLGCRPNGFVVRRPAVIVRRPAVIVRRPAFVVRRPAFVLRRPAFVVRRPACRIVGLIPHRVCY